MPVKTFAQFINQLPPSRRQNMFFIQIGGFDGVFDDPIHQFIQPYHWSGIIIEPQPEYYSQLTKKYQPPQIKILNLAISNHNQPVKLYRPKQDTLTENWKNCFATMARDRGDIGRMNTNEIESITVPSQTFNNLIQDHHIDQLNLLQIDTEGYDYQIIKSIDFSLIKPDIIHYEHRHLTTSEKKDSHQLLAQANYQIIPLEFDTIAHQ
ncbi:MAG: FkbM family methyltransferase [Patescibacteria group bacterium]